jgi:hypothetical protein
MKRLVLNLALPLLIIGVTFIACKKNNEVPTHVNQGTITFPANYGDYSCATCGGYYIKFTTDTSTFYRTFQDLSAFGVTINTKFPVKALIGWKPDTTVKLANFITITSLKIDQ